MAATENIQITMEDVPSFTFGVIADVQYADLDDGSNFSKTVVRRYRNSLSILDKATQQWASQTSNPIQAILQLGDLLDGQCTFKKLDLDKCVKSVLAPFGRFPKEIPRFDIIGNHECYNFSRDALRGKTKCPLNTSQVDPITRCPSSYYSYVVAPGVRFVVLDAFEISTANGKNDPTTDTAIQYLKSDGRNKTDFLIDGVDWATGLTGLEKRFVPYNGMMSTTQLAWLAKTLDAALVANEKCVVASHISLIPGACSVSCVIWNYEDALPVLHDPRGYLNGSPQEFGGETPVIACMYGHAHQGGCCVDQRGIPHITFQAPLEAVGDETSFATVEIVNKQVIVHGEGRVPSRKFSFPPDYVPDGGVFDPLAVQNVMSAAQVPSRAAKDALSKTGRNESLAIETLLDFKAAYAKWQCAISI